MRHEIRHMMCVMLMGLGLMVSGKAFGQVQLQVPAEAVGAEQELLGSGLALSGTMDGILGDGAAFGGWNGFEMPGHVRENPRGFSPLCRLEIAIEEKLPVGVWVTVGDNLGLPGDRRSNASVRFKLLRF
ncbi:MAG: hypothetical protein AAF570_28650 [Bacteroidota bacterium]